ncbi:MAG: Holliday junction resolvase RuvX [Erysipelotrichaceae bacterium]
MRVLGLDLGSKTLGIAMSDALKMIANPIETYRFEEDDYQNAIDYLIGFCKKNSISEVVLGLPKHMNGDVGIRGEISKDFKAMIEEQIKLPVTLWDERLSTVAANRILLQGDVSRKKRKQVIDKMAAVVILQSYLDSRH